MILIEDILELHEQSISDFGGSHGIRDIGLLESAIARPFQTFDGEHLYSSIYEKAAALGQSLIVNHPFVDGNKRTGLLGMASLLIESNLMLTAVPSDVYNFVINISTGAISFEEIVEWVRNNTKEK